ncbi:MAG TPA: GRAM domain-containing protein [Dissulfurispiraceae bacterium]|nr:GRAM domain-containing protein [Dissulfurispiraceae bacterium]
MYRFSVEKDEKILKKGCASLHIEDATLSGALYLTNARLVFVGHILGGNAARKELSVPLTRIASVKGGKTALIIPNAVDVVTTADEKLRLVLRDRREWLSAIERELSSRL